MAEEGMEKYGVACGCTKGEITPAQMTKLSSGELKCPECGIQYDHLKLKDVVKLQDNSDQQRPRE